MANDVPNPWKQNARDAAARIEEELRGVAAYINDVVVPEVRLHGSQALRAAAEQLQKLAQRMDDRRAAAQGGSPPTPPAPGPEKDKSQP
jgi:hypothetical protein